MKPRYIVWFGNQSAMHLVRGSLLLASVLCTPIAAQESKVDEGINIQVDLIAGPNQEKQIEGTHAENAERWVRGFIQNEFHLIDRICHPSAETAQKLVDLAEKEWYTRLSKSTRAYASSGNDPQLASGFETKVERLVAIWVRDTLPEDQRLIWQQELDARVAYRKRMVIGKMVIHSEQTYGLSASQMLEIDQILQEKWKDAWWGMYRTGTLPEVKYTWISSVLSESQRTLGTERVTLPPETAAGGFIDMPSLPLKHRFKIGGVTSSANIPLVDHEAKKDAGSETNVKAMPPGQLILEPNKELRK